MNHFFTAPLEAELEPEEDLELTELDELLDALLLEEDEEEEPLDTPDEELDARWNPPRMEVAALTFTLWDDNPSSGHRTALDLAE